MGYPIEYSDATNMGSSVHPQWLIIVYVNHIEHGRGIASTVDSAKDMAADQAYEYLCQRHGLTPF
ncbi:hypothetical protein FISHEDRAFT_75467 [Fistulina hepatica ATCC 64428]|uniref:DRBM domain-containing protein n=1 Tax=Fistulina hepatica ATCC 64428 TaxID=1128425 RepID=A0A0D7A6J8_9AGAR|nr:hypothetical protein FISHEDRAFT_75467 [Fistulina hepatica ATCC 64428]